MINFNSISKLSLLNPFVKLLPTCTNQVLSVFTAYKNRQNDLSLPGAESQHHRRLPISKDLTAGRSKGFLHEQLEASAARNEIMQYVCSNCGRIADGGKNVDHTIGEYNRINCDEDPCPLKKTMKKDIDLGYENLFGCLILLAIVVVILFLIFR